VFFTVVNMILLILQHKGYINLRFLSTSLGAKYINLYYCLLLVPIYEYSIFDKVLSLLV